MKYLTPSEQGGIYRILYSYFFLEPHDYSLNEVKSEVIAYIGDYSDFKVVLDFYEETGGLELICWFEDDRDKEHITYNFTTSLSLS